MKFSIRALLWNVNFVGNKISYAALLEYPSLIVCIRYINGSLLLTLSSGLFLYISSVGRTLHDF